MGYTVLIPARLASSRLPNKPLADIGGVPMVVRVAQRVHAGVPPSTRIVVAADSPAILGVCHRHKIEAVLTRDREQVIPALKKYLDMNKLAMGAVKPGGILLTCSCTGLVSEAEFLDMLRRAAFYAGRSVQVLKVSGAGADHPWLAHVPESRYLKAVFCRVE